MTSKLPTKLALAAAAALLLGAAGCQNKNDPKMEQGMFKAADEPRTPKTFADAQASAGARDDGMLYNRHFDGDQLNSLGRAKLELIAQSDDSTQPVAVHFATVGADDKLTTARKEAVGNYLKDCGLTDEQIKLMDGANESTYSPSQNGLTNMSKTETSLDDTADASTSGGASGGAGAGGASGAK